MKDLFQQLRIVFYGTVVAIFFLFDVAFCIAFFAKTVTLMFNLFGM